MFSRSLFLVIAAVVCSCVSAPAQQARVFGEADKIAIEKMYDRYLLAFIKKDWTKPLRGTADRRCVSDLAGQLHFPSGGATMIAWQSNIFSAAAKAVR